MSETLQALISRSALEWRMTFDALVFPLLLLEMDGRIVRMNEAARALAGVAFEAAIHRLLEVLGAAQPWPTVQQLLARVATTGERAGAQAGEENGRVREVTLNPVLRPDSDRLGVVIILD